MAEGTAGHGLFPEEVVVGQKLPEAGGQLEAAAIHGGPALGIYGQTFHAIGAAIEIDHVGFWLLTGLRECQETPTEFRHGAPSPFDLVGAEGRNGSHSSPEFRILFHAPNSGHEFLRSSEGPGINEAADIKVPFNIRIAPINRNASGGLGMEQLLCAIAGGRGVFIGDAEAIVLEKLDLSGFAATAAGAGKESRAHGIEKGSGRIHWLPGIQRLIGGIAYGIRGIRHHKGTEAVSYAMRCGRRTEFQGDRNGISDLGACSEPVDL